MTWAGIIDGNIIGPYYFEQNVTSDTYLEMLRDYVVPELNRYGIDARNICYMHDGAPAHSTLIVRQFLTDNFGSWIGRGQGSYIAWPPRSPDLNMLDFFLWGMLQHRVNITQSRTTEEIEQKVRQEMNLVSFETLEKVHDNLKKRLRVCVEQNGELFEHMLK